MTCSGKERISYFEVFPQKVTLTATLSKSSFCQYISGVINKPNQYKYLTGWVNYKKSHAQLSEHLKKTDCVVSQFYSPNCKIFIFLVNFMSPEWLSKIHIFTTTAKIELMYILVTKGVDKKTKNSIYPKPVSLTSPTTYLFVSGSDKIGLRAASLEQIMEVN